MNSVRYKKEDIHSVSLMEVCLIVWVVLAFLSNIILNSFSARLLMILAFLTAVLYALFKRIIFKQFKIFDLHFFICWIIILIGYTILPQPATLMDIIILISGYVIVRCYTIDPVKYLKPIKLMIFFGIFFSVGEILNFFLPSIYNLCLGFFPSEFASAIRATASSAEQRVQGFTTNPGHSAGFIVIAIFACIAQLEDFDHRKKIKFVITGFMFAALLLTGKRAHFLFAIIVIILCYLLPVRGKEKMKRYWKIFLVIIGVCVVTVILWDYLITIPFFARLNETLNGFLVGEDVTSARSELSLWALQIFKENPITGIGWNVYKTTVIGNATMTTALDTHNIYLQLLCETGIIGFLIFVSFFIALWIQTKNAYIDCVHSYKKENMIWSVTLKFSFMFQTFFLLYGLTGNPLYDQSWQMIYMFSTAIYMGYHYRYKGMEKLVLN